MSNLRSHPSPFSVATPEGDRAAMRSLDRASAVADRGFPLSAAVILISEHILHIVSSHSQKFSLRIVEYLFAALADDNGDRWATTLALGQLADHLNRTYNYWGSLGPPLRTLRINTRTAYANYLERLAQENKDQLPALLVRGFAITHDSETHSTVPHFPEHDPGAESHLTRGPATTFAMPPAATAFRLVGDYAASYAIAQAYPDAHQTLLSNAWAAASQGIVHGDPGAFHRAANEFIRDTPDRPDRDRRSPWSSINVDRWAPYFRARGLLSEPCESTAEATSRIIEATAGYSDFGFSVPEIARFQAVVSGVAAFLAGEPNPARQGRARLRMTQMFDHPEPFDAEILDFLDSLDQLASRRSPNPWFSDMNQVVRLLDRIPALGQAEKSTAIAALESSVPARLHGWTPGWIGRCLEAVTDERVLHRLLLAVFRAEAEAPHFSQIRHGPVEYGKDIVVIRGPDGERTAYAYSAKIGQITKQKWQKEVRPQLEEIFQAPLKLPSPLPSYQNTVAVLVWTGAFHPLAEPIVEGWVKEQERLGRTYQFMNFDGIVRHVQDGGLQLAAYRAFLAEGINPAPL